MKTNRRTPPRNKTKRRASLSMQRGPVRVRGNQGALLKRFFDVPADGDWRQLSHGFHTYPGRMHLEIPRRILREMANADTRVLDPFCGSGTTLVETMLMGARGRGVDVLPMAVRIARIKCSHWTPTDLERLTEAAAMIADRSLDLARTRGKTETKRRPHPKEKEWFQPHVRYEIANLIGGIEQIQDSRLRDALEMVLSSMLVKVSNQQSHSSRNMKDTTLPRGFTSRFFSRRANELGQQLFDFSQALPPNATPPRIRVGDARRIVGFEPGTADLIISSPPYPGTYNYENHQWISAAMLEMLPRKEDGKEIGSRAEGRKDPIAAITSWEKDFTASLKEMRRVIHENGQIFLVMGTSKVGSHWVQSDKFIEAIAPRLGLKLVGIASQELRRPSKAKTVNNLSPAEHLLWLQPTEIPKRTRKPKVKPKSETDKPIPETEVIEAKKEAPQPASKKESKTADTKPSPAPEEKKGEGVQAETNEKKATPESTTAKKAKPKKPKGKALTAKTSSKVRSPKKKKKKAKGKAKVAADAKTKRIKMKIKRNRTTAGDPPKTQTDK